MGIVILVIVVIVGLFFYKAGGSGPKTEGVESMPDSVKQAFMKSHSSAPPPTQKNGN